MLAKIRPSTPNNLREYADNEVIVAFLSILCSKYIGSPGQSEELIRVPAIAGQRAPNHTLFESKIGPAGLMKHAFRHGRGEFQFVL